MRLLAAAVLCIAGFCASAITVPELAGKLMEIDCFKAQVSYTVSLPQASDDVRYALSLESRLAPADSISPISYLIDWTFKSPAGETLSGFSAYFDGHHYRYRNDRMQQWHMPADASSFRRQSQATHAFKGVHRSVQFANLLPAYIGADLTDMLDDSLYRVEILPSATDKSLQVRAVMEMQGQKAVETLYSFQPETLLPISIETRTGEGSMSEQELSAQYVYSDASEPCQPIDAARMAAERPALFDSVGTFTPDALTGNPLPSFTLRSTRGDRITHLRNQPFGVPTLIVVLDPSAAEAAEAVKAVRDAIDHTPEAVEILWASTAANPRTAIELLGQVLPGETLGINASNIVREWGITTLPTLIICNADATVEKIIQPVNKTNAPIVTQSVKQLIN